MTDPKLDDSEKEKMIQRHSLRLFFLFFTITGQLAVAAGTPLFALWILDKTGWISRRAVMAEVTNVKFIIFTAVAMTLILATDRRLK